MINRKIVLWAFITISLSLSANVSADIYTSEADFLSVSQVDEVTIPGPSAAITYPCWGSTAWGCGNLQVYAPLLNDYVVVSHTGRDLWMGYDLPHLDPSNRTNSAFAGNGEDDYTMTLPNPATAIGIWLITNHVAKEIITLRDSNGNIVGEYDDSILNTGSNGFYFIGITSESPFQIVDVDTTGGADQNEAIYRIYVGQSTNGGTDTGSGTNTGQVCNDELNNLIQVNLALEGENSALKQEVTNLKLQTDVLEQQNISKDVEIEFLKIQNADQSSLIEFLEEQNASQAIKISNLEAENSELESRLANISSSVDSVESRLGVEIPGTTEAEKLDALVNAILNINNGRLKGIIEQF